MTGPSSHSLAERLRSMGSARSQTALFVVSTAGAGLLGIVAQALVARELGVEDFAIFAFALAVLQFAATFFEFGLFIPAARQAALADAAERAAIVGAALVTYVPVAIAFSALILLTSLVAGVVVDFDAGPTLALAAIGAFAFPFMLIGQSLSQGTGRLHVFSIASLTWQAVFVALLVAFALAGVGYGSSGAVLLREGAMATGVLLICIWLRPRVSRLRERIGRLVADAREWGRAIYVGRVLSTSTYNMDTLLVGLFAGVNEVAFYAPAKLLAYSISLPATGASGALFVQMASRARLRRRWLQFVWGIGLGGAALLALVAAPLVDLAYGDAYAEAAALVLPLAFAEALRGVGALYNGFFNAHAQGRVIRRAAIVFTVTNLITNFSLIPAFGAAGAAVASLIAMAASLAAYVLSYRRMTADAGPA